MDIRIDCAICCTDTTIDGLDDGLQLEHALMALNSYHIHTDAERDQYYGGNNHTAELHAEDTDE
ncbi:hypothetical protein [Clavibacter capsici]|uniref:hypothetical protein n=1 Tax=Clavibacter capsici TaxID=1874630 RepID=UPI0014281F24|nr:hypothetical protein [Clavibacter capsici]QIS38634.1 hypothetical protein GW572_04470 [Clavibacter capsici]